jgi:2-polyprenyl-6-methoxyphenol hydroxylase-like FAD-dependent oxidoreductase
MADTSRQALHATDQTTARRQGREHAIVIGASMAGLLAARVLSDSFDRVTVLDRDTLPTGVGEPRRSVPQGRHVHALRVGGQEAFEELFPGFKAEAREAGAPELRAADDMRVRVSGHLLTRVLVCPDYMVASRPLLEGLVRRRVGALANVTLRDRCDVLELVSEGERVTGVQARGRDAGSEETLGADLVVAASGRGGRVPAWLDSIGYEGPVEERVDVDIMYASRVMRLRPGALGGDKFVLNGAKPGQPRGTFMIIEEGDRWNMTLFGYGTANHPPNDPAGWNAFAATVADADVIEAIEQAESLGEVVTHAFPANVRRRYENLRRFPAGLLVIGDALCAFNPIYAQGMTVATFEAFALQRCLQDGDHRLAQRYFKAASVTVDQAWKLATGADLALPEVEARAALSGRLISRYVERLLAVAESDEQVARAFIEVTGMVAPPTRLLHPAVAMRVLRGSMRRSSVRLSRRPAATARRSAAGSSRP